MNLSTNLNKNRLSFIGSIIFLFSIVFFLQSGKTIILISPLVFIIILISLLRIDYLFYMIIFLTPISISSSNLGIKLGSIDMALPTEPLLLLSTILTILFFLQHLKLIKRNLNNSISLSIILYLFWMLISSITSTMTIVSLKFFLTRLCYIITFFFLGIVVLKNKERFNFFTLLYSIPFALVIVSTIIKHSKYFFDKQSGHFMMWPYFNDHTSYGAMIAFFIPLLFCVSLNSRKVLLKITTFFLAILFLIGLILSFSRAAWISLICATFIMFFIWLKLSVRTLLTILFSLFITLFVFQNNLITTLSTNDQDSSDNLVEHFSSLSNITTDASNMERINRWKCALKMFKEKPILGWGPSTYQFNYAPYQISSDKTIISTNYGDGGNAHSEYLGILSESGIIGLLTLFLLLICVFFKIIKLYYNCLDNDIKRLLLALFISLLSYFIHSLFNNFLDMDKASVAVWASLAIIVSIEQNFKKYCS